MIDTGAGRPRFGPVTGGGFLAMRKLSEDRAKYSTNQGAENQ
jgi:hypothetical protein